MLRAYVISPIVFFSLIPSLREMHDLFLAMMFSFQNGFFWQKTVSGVSAK
jgi:hypothetical protein